MKIFSYLSFVAIAVMIATTLAQRPVPTTKKINLRSLIKQ